MQKFQIQNKKSSDYFEGWYVRITDRVNNVNLAIIFAKTLYKEDPHAFIQVYDGVSLKNHYYRFDIDDFSYENNTVYIKNNSLSVKRIVLALDVYTVDVMLKAHTLLQKESAMGYLEKFPLECYQEVIFLDAEAIGTVKRKNNAIQVKAKGYMEKTYGRKFPKKWFWLQANHFDDTVCLTLAGGSVPTLTFKPFGFFAIFQLHGEEHAFGTYNLSRMKLETIADDRVRFVVKKRRYVLEIIAHLKHPVELVGPNDNGEMNLPVFESLSSHVKVVFKHKNQVLYEGSSAFAGFEWMYDA